MKNSYRDKCYVSMKPSKYFVTMGNIMNKFQRKSLKLQCKKKQPVRKRE